MREHSGDSGEGEGKVLLAEGRASTDALRKIKHYRGRAAGLVLWETGAA